jgi:hypothetical protein
MPRGGSLGQKAELEGKKARAFPPHFVDGAVFLGPLKVGQVPPLSSALLAKSHHVIASVAKQSTPLHGERWIASLRSQ